MGCKGNMNPSAGRGNPLSSARELPFVNWSPGAAFCNQGKGGVSYFCSSVKYFSFSNPSTEKKSARMVKLVFMLHKHPDLTEEAFLSYWNDTHAPLAAKVPGLCNYVLGQHVLRRFHLSRLATEWQSYGSTRWRACRMHCCLPKGRRQQPMPPTALTWNGQP